jgi:hypothetical protein
MAKSQNKIPADRLLFAPISTLRTLAVLLSRRGVFIWTSWSLPFNRRQQHIGRLETQTI